MLKRSGQSTLEYVVLVVILLAALLTMQVYMRRGISGRWQTAFDDIADQYDPLRTNGAVIHRIVANSSTVVTTVPAALLNGYYTMRTDLINSSETTTGSVQVGN